MGDATPTSPSAARHLRVHGRVQGVGYRQSLVREARRLGLRGWVRNRSDGTVEALAVGPAVALDALLAWAHRGPPAAAVLRVDVQVPGEAEVAEAASVLGFEQRPTV